MNAASVYPFFHTPVELPLSSHPSSHNCGGESSRVPFSSGPGQLPLYLIFLLCSTPYHLSLSSLHWRQGLAVWPRLSLNSWQSFSSLLSTGIIKMCPPPHIRFQLPLFNLSCLAGLQICTTGHHKKGLDVYPKRRVRHGAGDI